MKFHTKPALRVMPAAQVQISLPVQGVLRDVHHAFLGLLGPTPNSWHGYSAAMCRGAPYSTSTCAGSRRSR
jgi:hypothetical protein